MEVIIGQLTKSYKNNVVKLSVFICFICVAVFGTILSFHGWVITIPNNNANAGGDYVDTDTAIQASQIFSGIIDSEQVKIAAQNFVSNYKKMLVKEIDMILSEYDLDVIHKCFIKIWPELSDTHIYKTLIRYAGMSKLAEIYILD